MYLLEIDRTLNRIHITLSDRFDEPQAKALFDELRLRLGELESCFDVLCDLTTLEKFDQSAKAYYLAAMDLCNECGVRKVVRIIPEPLHNFGLTDISQLHYDCGVPVITCSNLKDALTNLKWPKRGE